MPTLQVSGMTCASCSLSVRRAAEDKGATHVHADAGSGRVTFSLEEGGPSVAVIEQAIKAAGYGIKKAVEPAADARDHHHAHDSFAGETRLLLISAILTIPLLAHMWLSWPLLHNGWFQLALTTPVFGIGLWHFGPSAWRALRRGVPNMDVLILLGAVAAFVYSLVGLARHEHTYIFFETTASIITLVLLGNWLERRTGRATESAIDALARLQPRKARVVMTDSIGKETILETDAAHLRPGDVAIVAEGDALPADGVLTSGEAHINEQMLTGESDFVRKGVGDEVTGGTIVAQGNARVRITATGEDTALASIIRLVREAQANRPPLQKLADRISAWFVPAVMGISILTYMVSHFALGLPVGESMMRAIAVLVIACPCAMGLATPAAIAVGLGRAARNGILIKGGDTLERLKGLKRIVFDKTGTLTTGQLAITRFEAAGIPEELFKSIVATLETPSTHPVAQSIVRAWGGAGNSDRVQNPVRVEGNNIVLNKDRVQNPIRVERVVEVKGKGMEASDARGHTWSIGSKMWLAPEGAEDFDLFLFENDQYRGGLSLQDALRPDAASAIAALKAQGYMPVLLSGDRNEKCAAIAREAGIDEWYGQQSPAEKHALLTKWKGQSPTAMVGDGINDAPSLAAATVGISLGSASQIAIQSAQLILTGNRLSLLPKAIRLGILTEATIRSNLAWAFLYNVIAIPFAAAGYLSPTWGAGIMALSDVVLALNSLRLAVRRLA